MLINFLIWIFIIDGILWYSIGMDKVIFLSNFKIENIFRKSLSSSSFLLDSLIFFSFHFKNNRFESFYGFISIWAVSFRLIWYLKSFFCQIFKLNINSERAWTVLNFFCIHLVSTHFFIPLWEQFLRSPFDQSFDNSFLKLW